MAQIKVNSVNTTHGNIEFEQTNPIISDFIQQSKEQLDYKFNKGNCKGYELIQTVEYGDGFVYEIGRLKFETEIEVRTKVNTLKETYVNSLSDNMFRGQELTIQLRVFRHTEQGIPILVSSEELSNSFTPSNMGWAEWSSYEENLT